MASDQPADESVHRRDLVVIGASAGGVEVLREVVAQLPPDLAAAVCIVLHIAPGSPSALGPILQRAGRLPCRAARDGDELREGEVLVAPPDRHLVIEDAVAKLTLGPRENGHRPAVDALCRSAAHARGGRVIGVILSGTRDDGTAGLAVIKAHGGCAVVQDPEDALYAGMPASAIANVSVDAIVRSSRIADTVAAMVNGGDIPPQPTPHGGPPAVAPKGEQVTTICPECGGVLSERPAGAVTQWECRVGHRYSPDTLADAQAQGVEAALWAAVRALEDRKLLLSRLADQARARDRPRSADAFHRRAEAALRHAQQVRAALGHAAATTLRTIEHAGASDEETAA